MAHNPERQPILSFWFRVAKWPIIGHWIRRDLEKFFEEQTFSKNKQKGDLPRKDLEQK